MRRATIVLASALLVASLCWGTPNAAADSAPPAAELSVVGKAGSDQPEDFRFELGDTLRLQANGNLAKNIAAEWAKTTAIALYLDAELVAHLRSPPQRGAGSALQLSFDLIRDADDEANRNAWNRLSGKHDDYVMTVEPALALGNELPVIV